jgi:hypothetical protein
MRGILAKRSHRDKASQERTWIPKATRFGKIDEADGGRNPIRAMMCNRFNLFVKSLARRQRQGSRHPPIGGPGRGTEPDGAGNGAAASPCLGSGAGSDVGSAGVGIGGGMERDGAGNGAAASPCPGTGAASGVGSAGVATGGVPPGEAADDPSRVISILLPPVPTKKS